MNRQKRRKIVIVRKKKLPTRQTPMLASFASRALSN